MKNIIYRNYRTSDFNNYAKLRIETEKIDQSGLCISTRTLAEELDRPNYFPEKDLFVAETEKKIVGYISITIEAGIKRALAECLVHPGYRRKGTASKLFAFALQRAKNAGMNVTQISIAETNEAARCLLINLGFCHIRSFLELKIDLYNTSLGDVKSGQFISRGLLQGEEEMLKKIQNRSFEGTWGFNPNTTEEILYQLNIRDGSPKDVVITFFKDKPIGYCWTRINAEENATGSGKKGQIHMLGVDPDYRKKGIGKHVLESGLSYLKTKGIDVVELTTDSENQAARHLYRSAGFKEQSVTNWYERRLA